MLISNPYSPAQLTISNMNMASVKNEKSNLLWKPKPNRVTKMDEFKELVNLDFGLKLSKYVIEHFLQSLID